MKIIFCIFILTMTIQPLVWADDAPLAQNDGAYGPTVYPLSLKEKSSIRMMKEVLTFNFGSDSTTVKAKFLFQNTDTQNPVTQLTGFPDVGLGFKKTKSDLGHKKEDIGLGVKKKKATLDPKKQNEIENINYLYHRYAFIGFCEKTLNHLETLLDGVRISSKVEYGYVNNQNWVPDTKEEGALIGWYVINMVIPPGGKKILERRYICSNAANFDCNTFTYIVHTGGGWHGTIGELKANLILGDNVKVGNLSLEPPLQEWKKSGTKSFSLVWTNFDPREDSSKQQIKIDDCPKDLSRRGPILDNRRHS